ncbi:MAG: TOBE domain-containing protein [Nocardioidaceae bacterium]
MSRSDESVRRGSMRLSTRNQLVGHVHSIVTGDAMAVVKVALDGGQTITSTITREAAEDLELAEGSPVVVLIKSTEVALAVEE